MKKGLRKVNNINVPFGDLLFFTRHLSVMLESGIAISDAVESLYEQTKSKNFRKVLEGIKADIANGQTLNNAVAKYPRAFNALYVNMLKVGEEAGTLEESLKYLSIQLKKTNDFRQKVISASMYPALILVLGILVGGGVSFFVLPKLIDLFSSLDVELPVTTKIMLWIATTLRDHGIKVLLGILLISILFILIIQIKKVKFLWHKFLLKIPALGKFLQYIQVTTFARNVGTMLKSGIPITQALEIQAEATSNLVYKEYEFIIKDGVDRGASIGHTLSTSKNVYFQKIVEKMIAVGEKTGRLDESLLYLADFFEEEVDTAGK